MLENKLSLVTGGHKGIGRALALAFAEAGSDVIVHYYREEALAKETVKLIEDKGRKAYLIEGDFSKEQDIEQVVKKANEVGTIDILVNNAAIVSYKSFLESSNQLWDEVMSVNAKAPFILTREFSKQWISSQKQGVILNITSISAVAGTMYQVHYCASKGALLQLTKQSAIELGKHGIRVNAIAPGIIKTDANAHLLNDAIIGAAYDNVVPQGRVGIPDDCTAAAIFLCSDSAKYINGQQLFIDGGWSAHAPEPQFSQKAIE